MKHDDLHTSIKVIDRELKFLKDACGVKDDPGEVSEDYIPDEESKKDEPRRRGRHKKGMPTFKKGEE